jgi:hypothetical protein
MEAISRSACSDEFLVHELVDSKFRQFTAKTGVLYSSKRETRSGPCCPIDEDHAGFDSACDSLSAFHVPGNNRSA